MGLAETLAAGYQLAVQEAELTQWVGVPHQLDHRETRNEVVAAFLQEFVVESLLN